ncbi:DUF63 family protein [Methanothermococcus okinawensis]|uniref:DUF63 family protein n=1 Tax=Methanothermococcus okinawensis (strain DSM 14208 / JCM 11175 / IH1) TaxID=647113 RepID=F8AK77_METOI|nr:DUF63 family protein [Methanothermococcus okinawensis]AEH07447.1 protein of unknown function DUF63 [Methanothermococcus okinawensis IH1]
MDIKETFSEFVYKYYIEPIKLKSGYNIIQEITYGILLFVMVYLFYKVCKLLNIKINKKFALTTIFYIILIALMRALVDAGYIPHSYYTVTPGIVILVGLYYMSSIIISGILFKKDKYHISAIIMALIPTVYLLSIFINNMVHMNALFYVLGIVAIVYGIVIYPIEKIKILKNKLNFDTVDKYAIISQLTDASATAVGIGMYGYWEQHPIPRLFMGIFGPYIMIPLKLIVVIAVLYIINKEINNRDLRNILKITIMALGLAPGLRDLFRTIMGV